MDTTRVAKLGIGQHGRKTDRIDAEVLARAVESGHIPVAHVLSPARRELRMQLAVRRALVESRSQYVTSVRGLLRAKGVRLPSCDPDFFLDRFNKAKFDEEITSLCAPLIAMIAALEPELAKIERKVQELAEQEPMTRFLMTAPGVGLIVTAMFVAVVDDAKRFTKAHQLQSDLGLVPNEDSIKAWADAIAARRGKRIAVIAVARRLAGVLWAMWRDGTVYDPGVVGQASALGVVKEAQDKKVVAKAIARATAKAKTSRAGSARTTSSKRRPKSKETLALGLDAKSESGPARSHASVWCA